MYIVCRFDSSFVTCYIIYMGLGQKPPGHKRPKKSPPIMKSTSYLYIGIFAHILDLLYRYLWFNITFEYYFS